MRLLITTSLITLLLSTPALAANGGTVTLSQSGSGAKIGQDQSVTAVAQNTGTTNHQPKLCLSSYSTYLNLRTDIVGSATTACVTNTVTLTPGQTWSVKWTLTGKKKTTSISSYKVALTTSSSSTTIASKTASYKVSPLGAKLVISTVPVVANPLRFQPQSKQKLDLQIKNEGDISPGIFRICLESNPLISFILPSPYLEQSCHSINYIAAGASSNRSFTFSANKLGTSALHFDALQTSGTTVSKLASLDVPFEISAPAIVISLGKSKKKGKTYQRTIFLENTASEATPAFRLCANIRQGKLISIAGEKQNCHSIATIATGAVEPVTIKVRGKRSIALMNLNLGPGQEIFARRSFSFSAG